jgi:21S rRNA (uridine2791-2'-O)-methyltransferase
MLAGAVARLPAARCITQACERFSIRPAIWLASLPHISARLGDGRCAGRIDLNRAASTSSSTRWKARQSRDSFAREAKTAGLKSRAAFKLLEINDKHRLFKRGDTVVDLGYAPGSWSQVAISKTQPGGRVVGIDIIPAQPPRGVSTIQGNFLSEEVREEVRRFVQDPGRGRARIRGQLSRGEEDDDDAGAGLTEDELEQEGRGIIERERGGDEEADYAALNRDRENFVTLSQKDLDTAEGRVVNVVLSDMSEPWPLVASTWIKSVSNPYHRMMNTSGMAFRDHAGSMVCSTATFICCEVS